MNLSRQLIFLLPLLAVLPGYLGIEGVYYSYVLAEILSAALAIILMVRYFRQANLKISAEIVSQ
ncbi:hypothetical protein N752_04160 [Desulforamulus aquiferis]|nr:hypothetical protein [Desulforamulus aquiferis]RYD06528.1 hypothetical protein N752_04160 [Desulforamulus aquiferis]